ncbi:hypothetical protein DFH06DRAFT_1139976 [Mycena polygramma]|nr:hypothetical protein DFH06DRAFT_1139976 [Mycena polygramma]
MDPLPALTHPAKKPTLTRLPAELILEILGTSRGFSDFAIRILYRTVSISREGMMKKLVSTLKKYAESPVPRSQLVHDLTIMSHALESTATLNKFSFALSSFVNLRSLRLYMTHMPPMLHEQLMDRISECTFPNLDLFRFHTRREFKTSLSVFINRHRGITALELFRTDGDDYELDPIRLPNLTKYTDSSSFLRSIVCENRAVSSATLFLESDIVEDEDLTALGRMTSPERFGVVVFSDFADEASVLGSLAATVKLDSVVLQKMTRAPSRISNDYAAQIAEQLQSLRGLRVLQVGDPTFEPLISVSAQERTIVQSWGGACQTLERVTLHRHQWLRSAEDQAVWRRW